MTHHTEAERAEFEAWLMQKLDAVDWSIPEMKDWYFTQHPDGRYAQQQPNDRWEAWQAARRTSAAPVPQEPSAAQSRFEAQNQPWRECSIEHARWVMEKPEEWMGYEARYLYAKSAALQPAEPEKCATCQSLEAEGVNIKQCAVPAPLQLPKPWGYAVGGRIFIGNLPEHIKRAVAAEDMKVQNLYTERQLLTAQRDRWHQPKNEQPQPR